MCYNHSMIKALLFDFARVILFPRDDLYKGELNKLHTKLSLLHGYSFTNEFAMDPTMLEYLTSLKNLLPLYMFTSGTIQNAPEIRPTLDGLFKKIYSASEMGIPKEYPLAYKTIIEDIGVGEKEIVFIDDAPQNIEAALKAGLHAVHYKNIDALKKQLNDFLKELPS